MNRFHIRAMLTSLHTRALAVTSLIAGVSATAHAEDPSQPGSLRYQVYSNTAAEVFWNRSTDDVIVTSYEIRINGEVATTIDALSYFSDTSYPVVPTALLLLPLTMKETAQRQRR